MEGAGGGTADALLLVAAAAAAAAAVGGVGGSDDDDDGFSNLTMGGTTEATDGDAHGIETEDAEEAAAFAAAARSEGEGALDGGGVGSVWRRGAFNMADRPDDDDDIDEEEEEVLGIGVLALLLLFSAIVEEADRLLVDDDEVEG